MDCKAKQISSFVVKWELTVIMQEGWQQRRLSIYKIKPLLLQFCLVIQIRDKATICSCITQTNKQSFNNRSNRIKESIKHNPHWVITSFPREQWIIKIRTLSNSHIVSRSIQIISFSYINTTCSIQTLHSFNRTTLIPSHPQIMEVLVQFSIHNWEEAWL